MYCWTFEKYNNIGNPPHPVLSISFEVDVPTGKVGNSLFFECRRHELPRGVQGHAPPKNFETQMLGNAIFNVFHTVFGPKQ